MENDIRPVQWDKLGREAEIRYRWAGMCIGQDSQDVQYLLALVDKLRELNHEAATTIEKGATFREELMEGAEAAGLEYREDDGPQPYWRNTRALEAECALDKFTWRPFETAPKDGSWVLLRAPSGYGGRPYMAAVAHYEKYREPHTPWQMSETGTFEEYGCTPTHWMPVPEAKSDD